MATIYAGTNDGMCASDLVSWVSARNHAGASFDSDDLRDADGISIYYHAGRGNAGIKRSFFAFDTSGVSVAPTDGTLKIFGYYTFSADIIAVRSEQGDPIDAGDFNSFPSAAVTALGNSDGSGAGTFAGISGLTYSNELSTWSVLGYNDIALNPTALSDMASLDTFKVCLMEYDSDYLDIAVTAGVSNGLYFADTAGTGRDPYIDYTPGVAVTDNATFFGANF